MSENGRGFGELDGDMSDAGEFRAAQRLSEQVDRMLAGHSVDLADPRLAVAERLSRLGDLLPPAPPAFERRVLAPLHPPARRRFAFPDPAFPVRALSLAAAMAVVVMLFVLTVPGQTALARLAAMFHLESVEVGINVATATPAEAHRIVTPRIERSLSSLEAAQQVAPVPILVPRGMPAEWSLAGVTAVYYPDLPARVPLNIILEYQAAGRSLEVIEYFIQLGHNLTIDSLSRIDETSTSAREVTVDGRRAILVETNRTGAARTLIWQQDGILLELEAQNLSLEDMLAFAASLQPIAVRQ
ncbi:MAG: hypothetical protein D6791_02365 [Chloroflexi bacterium]|nr:MAG: hypothetical protein D6791_02365 [Chloroflexota bacterium]